VKTAVSSVTNISFNEAWKDFLIIRAIPYKLGAWIYFDSNQKVTRIDFSKFLKLKEIEGQRYFCDESTIPNIPLCYPEQTVTSEIERKIARLLLGKPFEEWKRGALKGKREHSKRKIEARLGGAIRSEVQRLISDEDYWEALFSLHQILEHRLRKMTMFKSMEIDRSNSKISINEEKEEICKAKITTFKRLARIAFLVGATDKKIREELLSFDRKRDSIAHRILRKPIPQHMLRNHCKHGLRLMDTLEKCFAEIIPKPNFIVMRKFEVLS